MPHGQTKSGINDMQPSSSLNAHTCFMLIPTGIYGMIIFVLEGHGYLNQEPYFRSSVSSQDGSAVMG